MSVLTVLPLAFVMIAGARRRFPEIFADYQRRCEAGKVRLGEPYLWRGLMEPWVINFHTKGHWRSVSGLADIERGLAYLADHVAEWGVTSLAVPPLGAGSGGLDWPTVGPSRRSVACSPSSQPVIHRRGRPRSRPDRAA